MALQPLAPGTDQGEDENQQQLKMAMLAAQMGAGAGAQAGGGDPVPQDVPVSDTLRAAQQTPPAAQPNIDLAHATLQDQPATAYVNRAQSDLDRFQNKPMWKRMLVPALIGATDAIGAHSRNGAALVANGQQDLQHYQQEMVGQKTNLQQQLQNARQQQMSEYELDQRNRQQDILQTGNNQTKGLMAQIAANSRMGVADTNANARRDVADTNVGGRVKVAGMQDTSREGIAAAGNLTKLEQSRINADAALHRFLAGQDREDARQGRTFAHTDEKPTSDEDRRADLAQALNGYAGMLEDIATRRPELFGKGYGLLTQARGYIGTSDQDVAALKMVKEQLGIVQMASHSLRAAAAIAPIADSVVNFRNDPAVVIANARLAQQGVQTFINPQTRPQIITPNRAAPSLKSKVQTPPRPQGVPADAQWNQARNGGKGSWQVQQAR